MILQQSYQQSWQTPVRIYFYKQHRIFKLGFMLGGIMWLPYMCLVRLLHFQPFLFCISTICHSVFIYLYMDFWIRLHCIWSCFGLSGLLMNKLIYPYILKHKGTPRLLCRCWIWKHYRKLDGHMNTLLDSSNNF